MLVEAGAPGVVPQAAPVGLLFETDDFRNVGALVGSRFEGPELCQAGRSGADDGNTSFHFQGLLFFDFPSETNFTDSDTNWRFGAVNRHLRERRLRGQDSWRKTFAGRNHGIGPCDTRRLADTAALLYRHL